MTDLRKAAEMALEAFKNTNYNADYSHYVINGVDGAELITALTQALAQPDDIQAAVLAERDACAKVCEGRLQEGLNFEGCAAAIRRKQT